MKRFHVRSASVLGVIPLIFGLVVAFVLAACSGSDDSGGSSGQTAPDGTRVVSKISDVQGAPFSIALCKAVLTQTTAPNGNSVPHLWLDVLAKNTSQKTLRAVQVELINFDSFGKPDNGDGAAYRGEEFTINGSVAPGDNAESVTTFDHIPADMGKVVCTATKAAFSDGSSWSNSDSSDAGSQ